MSELLAADRNVVHAILHRHAQAQPDALFANFPDDAMQWTYAQALTAAQKAGAGLQALGVKRGDRVLCWLPNGVDFLRAWFGANYVGAVHAPCNLSWRGRMLENALALSRASVAVVHADLLPRLAEIELHALRDVIVIVIGGEPTVAIPRLQWHAASMLNHTTPVIDPEPPLQAWDDMQLIFTSGTTGASKGAVCSYAHMAAFMSESLPEHFGANATFLCVLPLFHAGGAGSVYAQLLAGGATVLPNRFRSDAFWPWVREHRVTTTTLLGVMAHFLLDASTNAGNHAAPADRDHTLGVAAISPLNQEALAFAERFGTRLWTSYGATEIGVVLSSEGNARTLGTAGRLRAGYEARLVDDNDIAVKPGAMGELIIRAARPWTFFSAYESDLAATHNAGRNGWYHTGDLMREGADGLFYFKDRKKDSIRRRGENISSQEVEAEVVAFAGISEAAAYAVPASCSDDEVMICIGAVGQQKIDQPYWIELVEFLQTRLPHYMVPRYYRAVATLPRNETGKVRKETLRAEGVTTDTWDRESAGVLLKGERIGRR